MHVIGIQGPYGSGKSTTAVVNALRWGYASGAKVFSNFPLRNAYLFDHYTDWYRIADVHGSILIFDESQRNWDGRTWNSKAQIDQTHVINYVRKMNSLFVFVLPTFENLESRVRQQTDILIDCHRTRSGTIINHIYDFQAKEWGPKGKLLNKKIFPLHEQRKIWKLKLFSTHSMINKFPTPPPNQTDKFFKELDKRHNRALRRIYGQQYLDIPTLAKDDLIYDDASDAG